jgi:hypothetical protein
MNYSEMARIQAEDEAQNEQAALVSTASLTAVAIEAEEILARWAAEDAARARPS